MKVFPLHCRNALCRRSQNSHSVLTAHLHWRTLITQSKVWPVTHVLNTDPWQHIGTSRVYRLLLEIDCSIGVTELFIFVKLSIISFHKFLAVGKCIDSRVKYYTSIHLGLSWSIWRQVQAYNIVKKKRITTAVFTPLRLWRTAFLSNTKFFGI